MQIDISGVPSQLMKVFRRKSNLCLRQVRSGTYSYLYVQAFEQSIGGFE